MILKVSLFVLFTIAALTIMFLVLRLLWRGTKTFLRRPSTDTAQRILDTADLLGIDTTGVRGVLSKTVGEKVRDLGPIESRTYGGAAIQYSAQLCDVEGEQRIALVIKDEALSTSIASFSKDREEYRIPLRKEAVRALISFLEDDEESFMRTAAAYESLIETKRAIEKDSIAKGRNALLRWFAFLPLKDFGRIDRISAASRTRDGREVRYRLTISAYIGKEANEIILVLRFEMEYEEDGRPGRLHYILWVLSRIRG